MFGDTVNTSSRLETTSVKMKIQISEITQRLLDPNEWIIRERGTIRLKGKGLMKTYWLEYRKDRTKGNTCSRSNLDIEDEISDIEQRNEEQDLEQKKSSMPNKNNRIHDSNYSLFVENSRFKMPCLIS